MNYIDTQKMKKKSIQVVYQKSYRNSTPDKKTDKKLRGNQKTKKIKLYPKTFSAIEQESLEQL